MREEPELNQDPLAEKLGRFTPDMTGLDRDALLFQAGRASASRRRLWPAVAGLLTLSQAATLLFFLTRSHEPPPPTIVVVAPDRHAPVAAGPAAPSPVEAPLWSFRKPVMTGNIDDLPPLTKEDGPSGPERVLTAWSIANIPSLD